MSRTVRVSLSRSGVDRLIREVQEYRKWFHAKTELFLNRLADEGYQIASAKFQNAVYDGTNDVEVYPPAEIGPNVRAVVAVGKAVLFIEFGTGVTYPDNHPLAAENGMTRGGYGLGKGNHPSWTYYGEPGTRGELTRIDAKKGPVYRTRGNPANMPMYQTLEELRTRLYEIAREVFQ